MKTFLLLTAALFAVANTHLMSQAWDNKAETDLFLDPVLREVVRPRHVHVMSGQFPQKSLDTTLDVHSYDIYFDWVMALQTNAADRPARKTEASIKIRLASNVDNLEQVSLDAMNVLIDSVVSSGGRLMFEQTDSKLHITPLSPVRRGQITEFTVYYANLVDNNGLYLFSREDAQAGGVPRASGFTFSQPETARKWFPCNDKPHDKALFKVSVRVPSGFTVVSNGVLKDSTVDSPTTTIQTWEHERVMPTYLFAVNASEYMMYPQEYRRADGSVVPIKNFHFPEDHEGAEYNAVRAVANVPLMFEAFERYFGRYPYQTYGHVSVSPVPFGGMEHQTMTTVNRRWLLGWFENGYAHEVAHHWLGDLVTCATWADIWLNEGGASWGEALFEEYRGGENGYMESLLSKRRRYMVTGLSQPPVYDIPIAIIFNEATTYNKSAWVYHMMRQLAGAEPFYAALRDYMQKYPDSSAQTYEFLAFVQGALPDVAVPWDVFFDQWLVQAGHPVFSVTARPSGQVGTNAYTITVAQTQVAENVPEAFITPLTIRITMETETRDTTVFVSERSTSFTFNAPSRIVAIEADPANDILCEKTANVVSVSDSERTPAWCTIVGRHPVAVGTPIVLDVQGGVATVRVHAITGQTVYADTEVDGIAVIPTENVVPGPYVVSVSRGTQSATFTVLVVAQ